ncbi:hypothetical protein VTK73DRAFT_3363 [Phialemonium thermophilum]|uniref:Chromo domain-containing protein n=1 Tax=Phialemonium thermophilum TaxID=223376 RepID=A0ABR3X0B5_9PEZI
MAKRVSAPELKRIEVALHSWPRYVPGSGPPPPPISLVPPQDSTAYIVDKFVSRRPIGAERKDKLMLYYTIGWTDLPAAKVAIPSTEVLNYVSPRALEEWEFNDLLRREQEKEQEHAGTAEFTGGKTRGRVGRPPKSRPQNLSPSPPPILDPEEEALILEKRAAGPSLSTPQKRKLDDILQEETEMDEVLDLGSDTGDVDQHLYVIVREPRVGGPADEVARDKASLQIESLRGESLSPTSSSAQSAVSGTAEPRSISRSMHAALSAPPSAEAQLSSGRSSPSRNTKESWKTVPRPASKPLVHPPDMLQPSPSRGKFTPLSVTPQVIRGSHRPEESEKVRTPGLASQRKRTGGSSTTSSRSRNVSPRKSSKASARARRRKNGNKISEETDTDSFEVKELQADKYDYDEAGNLVRFFKVLWEGDWPSWQNPTWEPEQNISTDLIKEYLKKKETTMKTGYLTVSPVSPAPLTWMPPRRYSSVAEAFEGGIESEQAGHFSQGQGNQDGDDVEDEKFLVSEDTDIPLRHS